MVPCCLKIPLEGIMVKNVIVGLNSAGFNSSSTLLIEGNLSFAVEEERLIREKRTRKFPLVGMELALKNSGLTIKDVNSFAIAWNPAINLEAHIPSQSEKHRYLGEILYSVPSHLLKGRGNAGNHSTQTVEMGDGSTIQIYYIRHHLCHAASYFISPFDEAAVLTVDAFGEKDCTVFSHGRNNKLSEVWSQEFPHSLGAFYSTFTEFCGFAAQNDEWKLMGASSYGDPRKYFEKIRSLVKLADDGSIELDLSYFNHYQFHRPSRFTKKLPEMLNLPPNKADMPLSEAYYDLAAAAQAVTEDIYFHLLRKLHQRVKSPNVVIAGGVALNSVANGKIAERTPFKNIFIPSAPDDGGGSLGAAYYLYNHIQNNDRLITQYSNYLGPEYTDAQIESTLKDYKLKYKKVDRPERIAAELISSGKIIGWFQGRLEFGDRALGNRSILADPRDATMRDRVNAMVKYRESFRPFAPSILSEYVNDYFVNATSTLFMEKVYPIIVEKRHLIPAVTHVDGTGRLQTVTREQNERYWKLINEFRTITAIPIVLNTSFNLKGEAIVCSPSDAVRTFFSSGLDALVMGSYLVEK